MKITQRTPAFIMLIAVLAAAGVWCHASAVIRCRHRLLTLELEQQQLQRRGMGDGLHERVNSLNEQAREFDSLNDGGIATLLEALSSDLRDLNVTDRSLTTAASSANGPFRQTPLTVRFTGPFSAVFNLLNRIDSERGLVRVRRLQIERDPVAAADNLTVSLQIESFAFAVVEVP